MPQCRPLASSSDDNPPSLCHATVILLPGQVSTCSPGTAAAGAGGPVEDPPRAIIRDSDTQVAGFKLARLGLSDSGNTALS